MKTKEILQSLASIMFIISGVMGYAFVYDVEPLTSQKHYSMERDTYNHTIDSHYDPFPSFESWVAEQDQKEQRFHDWIAAIADRVGLEAAGCFDPWYQDTTTGHSACAPDNWASGRD